MYVYRHMYNMCMNFIYIYIYIERERDTSIDVCAYVYIYIYTYIIYYIIDMYIYIYIYIDQMHHGRRHGVHADFAADLCHKAEVDEHQAAVAHLQIYHIVSYYSCVLIRL